MSDIVSTDILEFFKPDDEACMDALQQLRDLFPDVNASNSDFARFLIARKFNVKDAANMFKAHLEWRAANPEVTKNDCSLSLSRKSAYYHGFDREGHPLLVYQAAKHDPKSRDLDDTNRMFLFWMQHALAALPDDKTKITVLIDRTNAGVMNQDIEMMRSLNSIWQDNFPERIYRCIVHPTGMVFYALWNVIQVFLDPVTKEKVRMCYNASGVTEFIDPMYIPEGMAGTCTYTHPDVEEVPESPHVVEQCGKE